MKKTEYIVPEMEVLEMKYNFSLLAGSSDEEPAWVTDPVDPDDPENEHEQRDELTDGSAHGALDL